VDSSRNPRGIHRLSTDSYTVCTTARILGTNVGMNCGCCVDNKTCPQAAPIHPRVIPRQSTGGHAVRTGEIAEIHSFHRAYYYPCSSSRKFLLKTGCVDKSRTHHTKRRGPGTAQGRAEADFADTRHVRRGPHAARDRHVWKALGPEYRAARTGRRVAGPHAPITHPVHLRQPWADRMLQSCSQLSSGIPVDGPSPRRSADCPQIGTARPRATRDLCVGWSGAGATTYPPHGGAADPVRRNGVRS